MVLRSCLIEITIKHALLIIQSRYARRLFAFILIILPTTLIYAEQDHRAWQHGIELLSLKGRNLLIWSSWGNPPVINPGKDWQHDIYYSWMDSCANITTPALLIGGHEAQEPPSVAVNNTGKILLTWEDGSNGINQYAALLDENIQNTKNTFLIRAGGHSGHVAASKNTFLVAYSEDWIDADDGFLGRGTGKNLFARIVDDNGHAGPEIRVSPGTQQQREDWPLVAGAENGWLIVWQRYPERTLHAVVISHAGAILRQTLVAKDLRVGYHYDVQYIPALKSYFVLATTTTGGVAVLMNVDGKIIARNEKLPPLVSESRFVWTKGTAGIIGAYPVMPSGVAVIHISAERIALQKIHSPVYQWDYIGTTGTFVSPSDILFATLSTEGLKTFTVDTLAQPHVPRATLCTTAGSEEVSETRPHILQGKIQSQ